MGKKSRLKAKLKKQATLQIFAAPPEIAAAVDRICVEDRDWFALNPGVDSRVRPAAPDEFWPMFDSRDVEYVLVHQVTPGQRLRGPVLRRQRSKAEKVQ